MALFFTFKTQRAKADSSPSVVCSAWHPEASILAVAFDNATVAMYNEEGDRVEPKGIARPNVPCSCLAWHPKASVLVSGWRDGALVLWTENEEQREATPVHADHQIMALTWNPPGTRMLSADRSGQVGVWKWDGKARIMPLVQLKKAASITHLVFRTPKLKDEAEQGEDGADGPALAMEDLDAPPDDGRNAAARFNKRCTFLLAGAEGVIFLGDDGGNTQPCTPALESPVVALLYSAAKDGVVCLTHGMQLGYWTFDAQLQFVQHMKVKVSAAQNMDGGSAQVAWAGAALLVTSNQENVLRFWNLEKDENYLLPLAEREEKDEARKGLVDRIVAISYNRRKRALAAATREGRLVFWQFVGSEATSVSPEDWEPFADIDAEGFTKDLQWGPGENLISAGLQDAVSILHETVLKRKMGTSVAVIQLSPESVFLETTEPPRASHTVRSALRIKGLDLYGKSFCVWDGKKVELYQAQDAEAPKLLQTFDQPSATAAVHSDFLFIAKGSRIEVHNHQGHKIQTLQFTESEGEPTSMDVHGDFLAAATSKHSLKLWRLGKDVKGHGVAKNIFPEAGTEILSLRLNSSGTKVSLLCRVKDAAGHMTPDTRFHVYDVEADKLYSLDFAKYRRFPISHCWDDVEPRLVGCETRRFGADSGGADEVETSTRIEVATLFVSRDKGVVLQDSFPLERSHTALVGMSVPNMFFYARFPVAAAEGRETHIQVKAMPNFERIDCSDPKVKTALVNFSYHLTMGNMDEAYKAVKTIKDENVWHNMAAMCVKTKRLDVAELCLGNMQDAKAARALRLARSEPELEAQVAMLAVQLNMLDEAEQLYKQCKRYDLLNVLYMASGKWDLALQTAEKNDRIHLRAIHYTYARYFESIGDVDNAIAQYEASRNHRYEVPRMLWDNQQITDLEVYVKRSGDKELFGWWAQYNESNGNYEVALHFYEQAEDTLSRVRLFCFLNNIEEARELVDHTQNSVAAYHLARHYEDSGQLREAIQYFTVAQAYRRAISIAKNEDMETDVLQLALKANKHSVMLDAAAYFEAKGLEDKAVLLYQRGGNLAKAIMLCVKGKLFEVLTQIADDLDADADPEVFARCADFFVENKQFQRAAQMFINAKAYERALQLCLEKEVHLTDEMAESMTLPKTEDEDAEAYRIALLKKVAKVAKIQESYHLACKKYTQAGDKLKAMQMLLKSGDKERIIFFAQHSRQPDIYVMAANFLQNLDWHNDKEIMKTIIAFYTKARALDSLATFYDACAQVEIDEYRDYEKALEAMKEAHKYLAKSKSPDRDAKLQQTAERIEVAERFVRARSLVKSDPEEMIQVCNGLLAEADIEHSVRVGDVFALLVEFYTSQGNYGEAYQLIEKMRDRNIVLSYYLEQSLVENVYASMGIENGQQGDGVEEGIPEE
eukprot:EG_transcript_441